MTPRHERLSLAAITLTLLLLVTLPYVYAWHLTPEGHVYCGLLWLPDDQNVHLTWAKQASDGHFLLPNLYSADTIDTPPSFSNVILYLVGATTRLTGLPLILSYHAYRLLFTALAILTFHQLTTRLTPDPRVRLTATFLVAFSAGFGYVPQLLGLDPAPIKLMDLPRGYLFVPEAYAFTSALIYPLNIASMFLQCATYALLLRSHQSGKLRHALLAGLAAATLGNAHTYDSIPLLATLGLYFLYTLKAKDESRRVKDEAEYPSSTRAAGVPPASSASSFLLHPSSFTLLTLLLAAAPVAIQAWLYFFNPEFRYSKTHYRVDPLPLLPTLLSFGPLVPLAAAGAFLTRHHPPALLMTLWATLTLLGMYAAWLLTPLRALGLPLDLDFGRKLIEGLQLPLCFLAATALFHLLTPRPYHTPPAPVDAPVPPAPFAHPWRGRLARVSLLILFCLASTLSLPFLLRDVLRHRTDPTWPAPRTPLDLPTDYARALDTLDALPPADKPRTVTLAMPPLSNHIPPRTGTRVYVGHWAESIRFVSKFWTAHNFFTGNMSPHDIPDFLTKNHLTHLLEHPPTDPPATTRPSVRLSLPPLTQSGEATLSPLRPSP